MLQITSITQRQTALLHIFKRRKHNLTEIFTTSVPDISTELQAKHSFNLYVKQMQKMRPFRHTPLPSFRTNVHLHLSAVSLSSTHSWHSQGHTFITPFYSSTYNHFFTVWSASWKFQLEDCTFSGFGLEKTNYI